jgi:hypothetical protein
MVRLAPVEIIFFEKKTRPAGEEKPPATPVGLMNMYNRGTVASSPHCTH